MKDDILNIYTFNSASCLHMVVTTDIIVGYKVPLIVKHICCCMFMNSWPWHYTIYIYIYIYIYTYTIYTYIHTYIHIYTWEHNVRLPKWMSCHKVIVVITGRAHCFHDYMYMYIYNTYIYIRKHKKTYIYIHKMEVYVNWIMYISESLSLSCISSAIPGVALRYFQNNSKRLVVQT